MFAKGVKHKEMILASLLFIVLLAPLPNLMNFVFVLNYSKKHSIDLFQASENHSINLVKSSTSPHNYSLISRWDGSLDNTLDVFVIDDLAYLADKKGGLVILDVSNLTQPLEIGRKAFASDIVGAVNLHIVNDYAFIANDVDGARIIDLSNKTDPQLISEYHDETYYWDVYTSGNYAFFTTIGDGLEILDISDKANPIEIAQYNTGGFVWSVWGSGNYICITDLNVGLEIINVTEIASPTKVGFHDDNTGQPYSIFVEDECAFIAEGNEGLEIVNISDKSNPIEISQFTESGSIVDVQYSSDTIFLADKFNGLKVLDISNRSNPVNVGSYFIGGDSWNVFYQEEVVYLANGQNGLAILGLDKDNDDLADYLELEIYGTDPLNPDSDGDGFLDGQEINYGSNPNDPNDYPITSDPNPTESSGFKNGLFFGFSLMTLVTLIVLVTDRRRIKYTG